MKICLVCDNRDVPNWGCRSTSTALSQVLASEHEVVSTIARAYATQPVGGPLGKWWPDSEVGRAVRDIVEREVLPGMGKYAARPGSMPRVVDRGLRLARGVNIATDFIDLDPQEAATVILDRAGQNEHFRAILDAITAADVVVINGEGSAIMTETPRRDMVFQLTIICLAVRLGRPVHYVNAMVSDDPFGHRGAIAAGLVAEILPLCDSVQLRDLSSVAVLGEIAPGVRSTFVPDALFTWIDLLVEPGRIFTPESIQLGWLGDADGPPEHFQLEEPFIAVSGGSLAMTDPTSAIEAYIHLVERLGELDRQLLLVETCAGDEFLREVATEASLPVVPVETAILHGAAILASSALMVSGRYHPSIMASLGGAAFVGLGSNSHKLTSLRGVIDQDPFVPSFPAMPDPEAVDQLVGVAADLLAADGDRRKFRIERVEELAAAARAGILGGIVGD